ncbi:MAG TPA: hypothetical protein VMV05_07580 [bacterium]|nr:hypothetical protein [bacterium]
MRLTHAASDKKVSQDLNVKRSPLWPKVQEDFLKGHPACAACGAMTKLNVHHKFPFHYVVLSGRADLEIDPRNLITLCTLPTMEHHILLGHLDNYQSYDPKVTEMALRYKGKDATEIKADPAFKKAVAGRPTPFERMTAADKLAFRKTLDRVLPVNRTLSVQAAHARANLSFRVPA